MSKYLLVKTIQKELLSFYSLFVVVLSSVIYIILNAFILNYRIILVPQTSLLYKFNILITLVTGIWINLSTFDLFLFILSFLLVGLNVLLFLRTITLISHRGKLKLSIGGGTILALATTGCMSCGISIISVLGLSATLTFLPFHGLELHLLAIISLLFSAIYMFWKLYRVRYCKTKN